MRNINLIKSINIDDLIIRFIFIEQISNNKHQNKYFIKFNYSLKNGILVAINRDFKK